LGRSWVFLKREVKFKFYIEIEFYFSCAGIDYLVFGLEENTTTLNWLLYSTYLCYLWLQVTDFGE